jgi:hypothetical protein
VSALLNPRLWLWLGAFLLACAVVGVIYRAGGASARADLAEFKAAQAEAGRLAAQSRTREEAAARAQEGQWQAGYDQGARDGQKALDVARADAGRAGAERDRLRDQLTTYRAAVRRAAADPASAAAGPAADTALDLLADLLGRGAGALVDVAAFADAAHAAGNTCQRSADALTAPAGVTLFPTAGARP